MRITTEHRHKQLMAHTDKAARQLQDCIYQLAQAAMKDTNPHVIAWIVAEHDKIDTIQRRLHRLMETHYID